MSLLPWILSDLLDADAGRSWPSIGNIYDQDFGRVLLPSQMTVPSCRSLLSVPLGSGYLRPWRLVPGGESGVSNVVNAKDELKINLDVQQFKPEEIKVKVVDDFLVVEAKHEERTDQHGFVSRQFTRRYKLPQDVDQTALVSKLSSDGVLTLQAPKKNSSDSSVREIPITHTNAPAIKSRKEEGQKGDQEKMDVK